MLFSSPSLKPHLPITISLSLSVRGIHILLIFMTMAMNPTSLCGGEEEDYIDMEITSSPSRTRDFEFQMSFSSGEERDTATCPADELFYKGKLLPLHLPPRRQMVRNLLLHHPTAAAAATTFSMIAEKPSDEEEEEEENYYTMPLFSSTAPCTNTMNTPSDSRNISPSESCRVSCELNPDDYFFEWSTELSSFINSSKNNNCNDNQAIKRPVWSKKLKLIKNSVISQKLKASRAYLKSLFTKSACSDESTCAKVNISDVGHSENWQKKDESSDKYSKLIIKKRSFGRRETHPTIAAIMKNIDYKDGIFEDINNSNIQRRSFSGAIKRHSPTKCLSSSSSNSSSSSSSFSLNSNNGVHELHFLRRSSSATEIEGSIEAAIAHCKKSQADF